MTHDGNRWPDTAPLFSKRLTWVGLAIGLLTAAGASFAIWDLHRDAVAEYRRDASSLGIVLAELARMTFLSVDGALLEIEEPLQSGLARGEADLSSPAVHHLLDAPIQHLPSGASIFLADAEGRIVNASGTGGAIGTSLAGIAWFEKLRQGGVVEPQIVPPHAFGPGVSTVTLVRRLTGPGGQFKGLILGSLPTAYFEQLYKSVALPQDGSVTLMARDSTVLARHPAIDGLIGTRLPDGSQWFALVPAGGGIYRSPGNLDGTPRTVAVTPLRDYPAVVDVTVSEPAALAPWRRVAAMIGAAALASIVGFVLLFRALTNQFRRLEQSETSLFGQNAELQDSRGRLERQAAELARTAEALTTSERILAEQSEALRVTMEHMDRGIMMIDPNHRVQVCNGRAVQMLGLPEEFLKCRHSFHDVLAFQAGTDEFTTLAGPVRGIFDAGGMLDVAQIYERSRPNGRVIEIRNIPLPAGGAVRTYADITDRKAAEQQVAAARDQAEEARQHAEAANQSKSQFLATMSHEIRSPMNGVLGIIDLLRATEMDPDQRHLIELVHESAKSLLGVLNEILDFSKIEAGAVALAPEPVPIARLIASITEPVAHTASQKDLLFQVSIAEDLPEVVMTDPLRLRQILVNLLSNAVKFTLAGSVQLQVSAEAAPDGVALLLCSVIDTGIGIDPVALDRLFEPFSQADESTTRNFGGTGLGLTISRRLARLLGGDLTVASEPGWGSSFTLTLPLVAASPAEAASIEPVRDLKAAAAEPSAPEFIGKRVLVAEDLPTNRIVIRRQLERMGFTVDLAPDGHAALGALAEQSYDILITDFHMPGMDGIELATYLRDQEQASGSARLPILALTADVTEGARARCLAAGIDALELKPTDLNRLSAALHSLFDIERSAGPAGPVEPVEAPAGEPVFDDSIYRELFAGYEDEGAEWLEGFVTAAERLVEDLADHAAGGPTLRAAAHKLAGSALAAGAVRLGTAARRLEALASSDDPAAVAAAIIEAGESNALTRAAIASLLAATREAV